MLFLSWRTRFRGELPEKKRQKRPGPRNQSRRCPSDRRLVPQKNKERKLNRISKSTSGVVVSPFSPLHFTALHFSSLLVWCLVFDGGGGFRSGCLPWGFNALLRVLKANAPLETSNNGPLRMAVEREPNARFCSDHTTHTLV